MIEWAKFTKLPALGLALTALSQSPASLQSLGDEANVNDVAEKVRRNGNRDFHRNPYTAEISAFNQFIVPAIQDYMPLAKSIKANRAHRDEQVEQDMRIVRQFSDSIDEKALANDKLAPQIKNNEIAVKKMLLLLALAKEVGVHPDNFQSLLKICTERTGPYLQFADKSGNYLNVLPDEMQEKLEFMQSQLKPEKTKEAEKQYRLYQFLLETRGMTAEQIFTDDVNHFFKRDWEIEPKDALLAMRTIALFKSCYQDNQQTGFFIPPNTPFPSLDDLSEQRKTDERLPGSRIVQKSPINS